METYISQDEVRREAEEVFEAFLDAQWNGPKHVIAGDRTAAS